jgi:hypothetical protein
MYSTVHYSVCNKDSTGIHIMCIRTHIHIHTYTHTYEKYGENDR